MLCPPMLSSVSTSNDSPGLTRATGSWNWLSVYFRSPIGMCCRIVGCTVVSFMMVSLRHASRRELAPWQKQSFDFADGGHEDQRDGDSGEQRCEHLRNVVEIAGDEDRVAESFARRHELADDRADQREAD